MTVGELVEILSTIDKDKPVVVNIDVGCVVFGNVYIVAEDPNKVILYAEEETT